MQTISHKSSSTITENKILASIYLLILADRIKLISKEIRNQNIQFINKLLSDKYLNLLNISVGSTQEEITIILSRLEYKVKKSLEKLPSIDPIKNEIIKKFNSIKNEITNPKTRYITLKANEEGKSLKNDPLLYKKLEKEYLLSIIQNGIDKKQFKNVLPIIEKYTIDYPNDINGISLKYLVHYRTAQSYNEKKQIFNNLKKQTYLYPNEPSIYWIAIEIAMDLKKLIAARKIPSTIKTYRYKQSKNKS